LADWGDLAVCSVAASRVKLASEIDNVSIVVENIRIIPSKDSDSILIFMSLSFFLRGSVLLLFINKQYDFVTGRKETPDIINGKQLQLQKI